MSVITIPMWVFVLLIVLAAITVIEIIMFIIFVIYCLVHPDEEVPHKRYWE